MEYTITIPCVVKFHWEPEEPSTMTEPPEDEEFYLESFTIGNADVLKGKLSMLDIGIENAVYDYLKGLRDET